MASSRDSSAKAFLKKAGKYAGRAHEKMLQKMGKVDDPKDEAFQRYVTNFNTQHASAIKLQREVHRYLETMKGWHLATKSLMATSAECYEKEWEGRDRFQQTGEQFGLLGEDVLATVRVQLVEQLDHYVAKFGELKAQVNKRERKFLDYQRTKRELETIKGKEKSSDVKIQKAEEAYEEAERLYKEVNEKLFEDLPNFYDSRVQVYASAFQGFAQAHIRFFEEATKLSTSTLDLMTKLEEEAENYVTTRIEPAMDQSSISNGVEATIPEVDTPELKVKSEQEEEQSSPVPTPVLAEEGPTEGNSPPRDSKSSTPTSGDDDSQKAGSLKRPPPAKPSRPESFSPADNKSRPAVEVKGKPPSLTDIVGAIKPPTTAHPEQDHALKEVDKEDEGKEKKEQVLPATGEEDQTAGGAAEEKVTETPVQAEEGERVEKDEATGERLEQQVEEQPSLDVGKQEQADTSSEEVVDRVAAPEGLLEDLSREQEQPVGGAATQVPEGAEGSEVNAGQAEQVNTPPAVEDVPAEKGEGEGEKGEEKEIEGAEKVEEGAAKGEEGTVKGEEGTMKVEEGTVKGEEGTVKVEEGTGKGEEDAVKKQEGAVEGEEDAVKGEEDVVKGEEDVVKRQENAEKGEKDAEKGDVVEKKDEEGAEKKGEVVEKGGEGSEKKEEGGEGTKQPPADVTVLFKVKAVHHYEGVDEDELTLEIDDIISVIPYEDPEEQDDGWLMGICERTGKKGVFPQNFTNAMTN